MPTFAWLWCSLLLLLPASACQICLPMPTESLADRILEAEHLMLAREDPDQPYHLVEVRTLKGDLSKIPSVDVFLDSSTRRQLSANLEWSLLCGWFPKEQEWRRLALHDKTLQPVVATIIDRAGEWEGNPDARLHYFAGFLGHEDSELSDLAHIEVASAPYSKLLQYADKIPRDQLHEKLRNFRRMKWHALYILFLSQSDDPRDQEFIRKGLADAASYGLATRTAPFATALIEIDGQAAMETLAELYLNNADRRPEELMALHAAFKVHGNEGRTELLDSIVAAYGKLLEKNPELAPALADDLTRWKRFDHTEAFAKLLNEPATERSAKIWIQNYLRAGAEASKPVVVAKSEGSVPVVAIVLGLLILPLIIAIGSRFKADPAA